MVGGIRGQMEDARNRKEHPIIPALAATTGANSEDRNTQRAPVGSAKEVQDWKNLAERGLAIGATIGFGLTVIAGAILYVCKWLRLLRTRHQADGSDRIRYARVCDDEEEMVMMDRWGGV